MPSFRYKALDQSGASVQGILVADGPEDARARLRRMDLFPEEVERAAIETGVMALLPAARIRASSHVAILTRQMSVLLSSGVTVVDALKVLAGQTEHRGLARALEDAAEQVGGGKPLADALSAHSLFFDKAYVGMIASGEKGGNLDVVFARLADFLERRRLIQSRVSTALVYPALLFAMVVALLIFLSAFVVPTIKPLLEQQKSGPLPLLTQILFAMGDFARGWWWTLPAAVAVVLLIAAMARRRPEWRIRMDAAMFRTPILGRIWLKSVVARFAASFSTLLRTGVPAVEALETLEKVVPNAAFAAEVRRVRLDVVEGKDISAGMREGEFFPPMVAYMIAVGERSGNLAEVLEHLAQAHETEVDIASRRLIAALEPALVLVMAGAIGFVAMSLITTILRLSKV